MIEAKDLALALRGILTVLNKRQIPFHVTGGFASSYYGEPRFTQDIDLVVSFAMADTLDLFLAELSPAFMMDEVAIRQAVQERRMFQALHERTMIKIDFHLGESVPGELGRSKTVELLPGLTVPLVSKEDAILSKLLWVKRGSHKGRQDIQMMLRRSDDIDTTYLEAKASELGVLPLLSELRREVESGD